MPDRGKWIVRGYHADDVKPPKQPGKLALEVSLANDHSKDLEVSVLEKRKDIGRVEVIYAPYR